MEGWRTICQFTGEGMVKPHRSVKMVHHGKKRRRDVLGRNGISSLVSKAFAWDVGVHWRVVESLWKIIFLMFSVVRWRRGKTR